MAEEEAAAGAAGGFKYLLTRKIGPLPVVVWIGAAGLIYWYVKKRQTSTGAAINPATGYPAGSAQDQAALAGGAAGGGGTSTDGGGGSGGSTVAGQYPDNASWGRAAINYLVSIGVDPTQANQAIQDFLGGQPLSVQEQADVNLAVQALQAPPTPPTPSSTPPGQIVTPVDTTTYAANPPSGLTVTSTTDTSISVQWSRVANATGYTVQYGTGSDAAGGSVTVNADNPSTTIGGLQPATIYYVRVFGNPMKVGAPYASTTASTAKTAPAPAPSPNGFTGLPPAPAQASQSGSRTYTVVHGDTLYGIAAKVGVSESSLYANNKDTIEATAHQYGHSSSSNGNWIFPGETLHY